MENRKIVIFGCKNTTRYLINSLSDKFKISQIITISSEKNNKINLIKTFQRRFRQDLINGKIDQECLLIIKNLLKS